MQLHHLKFENEFCSLNQVRWLLIEAQQYSVALWLGLEWDKIKQK